MNQQNTRRGFTLIELLVVVLIIGILAAVAVPQYQKVVEKSRAAEAQSMLATIYKAYEVYYLANGKDPSSFSELDIDVPGERKTTSTLEDELTDIYISGDWVFMLSGNPAQGAAGVRAIRISGNYKGAGFSIWRYYYKPTLTKRLVCEEVVSARNFSPYISVFQKEKGDYCVKMFHGTEVSKIDSVHSFIMP
ncbi:MAG: type II secretion system protein [Elusimicrobiaceae bacterium]|nr:type II secretion system protein [Elusimicrobiaceae bacterium]